MRGRFARFKEETWALPDCGRRVTRNSTFQNLATWKQGSVGASEKQKEPGSRGLSVWGKEQSWGTLKKFLSSHVTLAKFLLLSASRRGHQQHEGLDPEGP